MANILVICPTHRDYRELSLLDRAAGFRFLFHDYASMALEDLVAAEPPLAPLIADPLLEIERIVERYGGEDIAGVVSTDDYPGSSMACAAAARLGLAAPDTAVNLLCQHKFEARRLQQTIAPEAVPDYELIDVRRREPLSLPFPVFVKPVKSFFSVGARLVASAEALDRERRRWADAERFFDPFARLFAHFVGAASIGDKRLIAETPLAGAQCTLEGFVRENEFQLVGIVDSILYPGTIAFARFEYPSSLPEPVQEAMAGIARSIMTGIGYNNGMFNVEFAYDDATGDVKIIEVNPRMASQFADLYEKVDGTNSYEILLDLALGKAPALARRKGRFRMATSCVLRRFENGTVLQVPSRNELDRVRTAFADVRLEILTSPGRRLSQELQDGTSFRYGIVNVGGDDRPDILAKLGMIVGQLPFVFSQPAHARTMETADYANSR